MYQSSVYDINQVFTWVDSTIVFCWIQNEHKTYKVFVQNRLTEIRRIMECTTWKLVDSKNNPADIVSRGAKPIDLLNNKFWFEGPEFLKLNDDQWPNIQVFGKGNLNNGLNEDHLCNTTNKEENIVNTEENLRYDIEKEEKIIKLQEKGKIGKTSLLSAAAVHESCLSELMNIRKFSDVNKLFRVTSWILKFINNIKKSIMQNGKKVVNNSRPIEAEDVQTIVVAEKNYLQLKKTLNIFEDEHGLLRCRGRLLYADVPCEVKFPCIISKSHYLTELLVINCHKIVGHNGVRETLNELRSEYWIQKGRNFVRNIIKQCRTCRRFEGEAYTYPAEPPLPEARVTCSHAFNSLGIDYAGPVFIKNVYSTDNKDVMFKAWISLITCCSSRCIYLDLATDYSGRSCVLVLRRFINRRGAPSLIISDNGSSFINSDVKNFVASPNIEWRTNIEAAPWQGGFFERMVRSVKRCLKKILFNSRLTYEEMITVLSNVETIVNNRPITYTYDELTQTPLTPNHLLYGRRLSLECKESIHDTPVTSNENVNKRVNYLQTLLDHFWMRWRDEYLRELREQQKAKSKKVDKNVSVNDIVLIQEHKLPRSEWRVGRVCKLIVGNDQAIPGACVDVMNNGKKGQLRRPINKLYPLEFAVSNDDMKIDFISDADVQTIRNA